MSKFMLPAAMSVLLATAPVLAQTTQAPPAALEKAAPAAGSPATIKYITPNPEHLRASKLRGVDVYNDQNEKIGDVTEVLLDKQGRIDGVVIGVGGFLGIGQRDVAVPFNAIQWQMTPVAARTGVGTTSTTTTTTGTTTATTGTTAPAGTATTPPPAGTAATTTTTTVTSDVPSRAILPGATKEQLKQAPEFKFPS
jgi:sporulation protein YlmC with PRC-barrel domain